jgi:hypothetical protein
MKLTKLDRPIVFNGEAITGEPQRNVTTLAPGAVPASSPRADLDRNPAWVLSAIALASIAAGAINIAAAATVGRGSPKTMAFFVAVAAAQLVWGAVAMTRHVSRWWLALGAAGNLVVVATWMLSRTVGIPGVYAGATLPARFPDGLATTLEIMVVVGAAALMIRGLGLARSAARSPRVTVAATVVVGALALGGVLTQAGAIGSSPTGNGPGVNGPAAPGGGSGTSGGTYGPAAPGGGGGTSGGGGSSGGGTSGGGSYGY